MPELTEVRTKWRRGMHFVPIFAAACLGLIAAVSASFAVSVWEQRLAWAAFDDVAGDYATELQNGLDQDLRKIVAMRAFYDASVKVDPDEFDLFTGRLLEDQEAKMRVTWSPLVTYGERGAFERDAQKQGLADYQIKNWSATGAPSVAPEQNEYYPVLYSTSDPSLGSTIGIDLNSEPLRRGAVERARDGDVMATASNIVLRLAADDRRGFFVALPVYRQHLSHESVEERRRNILGILGGTFQIGAVIDAILANTSLPRDVDLYLYPEDAGTGGGAPIYMRASSSDTAASRPKTMADLVAGPHLSTRLKAGDASWNLVVTPAGGRLTAFYRAWLVLVAVVLVFGAVLAYMWSSLRYALRLEKANGTIMELAQTDLLTSLANRRAFLNRLTTAFAASRRGGPPFAVLYLDIDDFKDVNDTLGHPMGDLLIKGVVGRLTQAVRDTDLVARFGGDEFAILQTDVTDPTVAGALAAAIGQLVGAPFNIDGHEVHITSSIGISLYSPEVAGPEAMMVQADLALYRAKGDGRNRFSFHSVDLDQQVHERVRVADELRVAIEEGELELLYQPQVDLGTGRIIGLEALVRWNHKTRGQLEPASFIPIAERTGAIVPLGHWVFEEACRQLKLWQSDGIAPPVVAVNVSGVQFKGASEFGRDIEESLRRWDIDPADVELELTESVLMDATQKYSDTLHYMRKLGTKIAIDDFGTGYSSLKYLTVYPVSRLKLAHEFVFRVTVDFRNAAVVRAAIRLANELGIEVIAEGVETEAQMRFLMAAGCRQAQGYYFSRPVSAAGATELLREGTIEPAPQPVGAETSSAA
jgi:diguanylate cyclase (GGDEF)-like protein